MFKSGDKVKIINIKDSWPIFCAPDLINKYGKVKFIDGDKIYVYIQDSEIQYGHFTKRELILTSRKSRLPEWF